ncbi:hypothetical protein OKJ48_44220 [Streptomyces kunmingensis]|uniref:DUF2812 domain-containing protein n=1 Tax=Streptomyces kunmingensis TaxID=68225 RepID=A0ABU6CR18_9ACTN|nr:hypothetical protein [Streptomyces kunmingensis]MEB3967195.1 hypothetical protein [Streptomyces kunmingensis]
MTDAVLDSGDYLAELARLLLARGLPPDHVAATVADLRGHLAESGPVDPAEELGPVADFARQLAPEGTDQDAVAPDEHVETWRWSADTYADEALLGRFGDEGWEVERIDALGRFVSHRDPEQPQRWEYRRELVTRGRAALDRRLAVQDWEPCGTWVVYGWYKRPKAATPGPAAQFTAPPPQAPARHAFFSRRFCVTTAVAALALIAAAVAVAVSDGEPSTGAGFVTGALAGAALPLLAVWAVLAWRGRRRQPRSSPATPPPSSPSRSAPPGRCR